MNRVLAPRLAERLYWLGRYLQRAETTMREALRAFDEVIDRDADAGRTLYAAMGVTLEYRDARSFLHAVVYGDHLASLTNLFAQARENGVECRHLLDEIGFSRLNALHNLLQKGQEEATPRLIDHLLSQTELVLGIIFSELYRPKAYHWVRFGQKIERVDLILRLFGEMEMVLKDLGTIESTGKQLSFTFPSLQLHYNDTARAIEEINGLYKLLLTDDC